MNNEDYRLFLDEWQEQLNEAIYENLYHYTNVDAAYNILNSNRFMLSLGATRDAEEPINKGKLYFLSLARSPESEYFHAYQSGVIFVLNGEKLSHNFKVVPVDYWGNSRIYKKSEYEERLLLDKPFFDDAVDYIKEIHILQIIGKENYELAHPQTIDALKNIDLLTNHAEIPTFFYSNPSAFRKLNREEASTNFRDFIYLVNQKDSDIGDAEWQNNNNKYQTESNNRKRREFKDYYDFIELVIQEKNLYRMEGLPESISRLRHTLAMYPRDFFTRLRNDIGNERNNIAVREDIHKLLMLFKKHGFKKYQDFEAAMQKHMKVIEEKERVIAQQEYKERKTKGLYYEQNA